MNATQKDWDLILNVGPVGYARMISAFSKQDGATGGSIVNISSISAHIAQPNRWTYNAAKGAVDQGHIVLLTQEDSAQQSSPFTD